MRIVRLKLVAVLVTITTAGCARQLERQKARDLNASSDMLAYRTRAPQIDQPLTLDAALAYAVEYNIDVWVASLERRFQVELATQSQLRMLPALLIGGESSRRSEFDASTSISLDSGEESLEPSYSSEKDRDTWDITPTWNLLDFGISYLRARQQQNRVAMAEEHQRRVVQNIALQVAQAFWRAVTARESADEADRIERELNTRLDKLHREMEEQSVAAGDGLQQEIRLLGQLDELRRYRRSYQAAMAELARLIGLPPGDTFTLAEVDLEAPISPATIDVEDLEWEALRSRPELFEKDLEQAISRDEAHLALAEMFPNLSVFWRFDFDNDRLRSFNQWDTAGLRVTWNLLSIPAQLARREAVILQTQLLGQRRTAIAVGILTQLHLALLDCDEAMERFDITGTISEKHRALLAAIEDAASGGKSNHMESLDQRMKYLGARAKHLTARATLVTSYARLLNTVGRTPRGADLLLPAGGEAPPAPEELSKLAAELRGPSGPAEELCEAGNTN